MVIINCFLRVLRGRNCQISEKKKFMSERFSSFFFLFLFCFFVLEFIFP